MTEFERATRRQLPYADEFLAAFDGPPVAFDEQPDQPAGRTVVIPTRPPKPKKAQLELF